jgi:hypothetical protein
LDYFGLILPSALHWAGMNQAGGLGLFIEKSRNSHFLREKTDNALAIVGGLGAYSLRANV